MHFIKLLPLLFTLQVSSAATIFFSYEGLAKGTDGIGNPFVIVLGGWEPGRLDFQGNPSAVNLGDITNFSFTASIPDTDAFGFPFARLIEFNDLLLFNASSVDGAYTNFTLVSEGLFYAPTDPLNSSRWDDDQVFRFSVMPNFTARLEAVSMDSNFTVTEGTILIIPEPSALALAGLGLVLLGVRRRR